MCLKPIKLRNPTKHISLEGGQPLLMEVSCGHCAECKKQKRLEYRFRSLYQSKECVNKGGFVLFDTLTYSEECVPYISDYVDIKKCGITDFTCFNNEHWRNFLKNLRRQLYYHYKGVTFKYFLTSEYGTDDRYTHRPHYHVLFFVSSNLISPLDFSRLVSKCWSFGRTDGVPYKTNNYVLEHCVFEDADVMKICNYVAKYVTKDSTFQKVVNARLSSLETKLTPDEYNDVKRRVSMFHRQSQGYGLYYLNLISDEDYRYLFENGVVRMKDGKKVVAILKLPLYYKRKLFYKCLKDADEKIYWQLNKLGVEYTENHLLKSHSALSVQYYNIYLNANEYEKGIIDKLLSGRNFEDFAAYKFFYKGRVRDFFQGYNFKIGYFPPRLTDKEVLIYDWIRSIISSSYVRSSAYPLIRCVETDDISVPSFKGDLFNDFDTDIHYTYKSFIKCFTHDEDSCIAFRNFDVLDAFLCAVVSPDKEQAQKTFDFIENLEKRFKFLFNYGKTI